MKTKKAIYIEMMEALRKEREAKKRELEEIKRQQKELIQQEKEKALQVAKMKNKLYIYCDRNDYKIIKVTKDYIILYDLILNYEIKEDLKMFLNRLNNFFTCKDWLIFEEEEEKETA